MLIGSPGTRKSSAIKGMKDILKEAGYDTIAGSRTSKEKFLLDLSEGFGKTKGESFDLDAELFGDLDETSVREVLIAADEFNNFIGNGNLEFISVLGELWDYSGSYQIRTKTSKSFSVSNPTISILGGNTPSSLSLCFPPETIGQGFFSRLILVYGEPNGKRIAFPPAPDPLAISELIEGLQRIKQTAYGEAELAPGAKSLLEKIYAGFPGVSDSRFESYSNRRFTHLLKLCLIITAANYESRITEGIVRCANSILAFTEQLMPKSLGEFGESKHARVNHRVIELLSKTEVPMNYMDIWAHVQGDLDKGQDLSIILMNLNSSKKIFSIPDGGGFLAAKKQIVEYDPETVDFNFLTTEERGMNI